MKKYLGFALTYLACSIPASAGLVTLATYNGQDASYLTAEAFGGGNSASGTLTVAGLPGTATVLQAYLYTNSWFSFPTISGNLGSANFSGGPTGIAGAGDLAGYRFDVTSAVTGNGAYAFNLNGGNQIYVAALAVVYTDASLPNGSVILNDVVDSNCSGSCTMSTVFNTGSAGSGTVRFITQADDTSSSGEQILFNSNVIGGPIDDNIGQFASLFNIPVSVNAGANTLAVTTNGDYYGWHVAILDSTAASTRSVTPEPAALLLSGFGLIALGYIKRRR